MTNQTILIVDDDRTTVRLCQKLLERASYTVLTAMDPLEGLEIVEKQKLDLLLSDIRMPIMDGFELITRAKQHQPDLAVLVMTGYGSIENAIQALHRGVDGLILKPFENTAELISTVQRVIEDSRQKREAARLQALRPLFDLTERLLSETSPRLLENLILNAVSNVFQAEFVGIFLVNEESNSLETICALEKTPGRSTFLQRWMDQLSALQKHYGLHSRGGVLMKGPDNPQAIQTLLQDAGWESLMVVPVWRNARHFLFCAARETTSTPFVEADLEMFAILARQSAVAIENARLYSELKDYLRRVEESQRALIQAEKMAAVGRLMATLAHEINNPLQSVRNCLHLVERSGIAEEQRKEYLEMTNSELDRLVKTVRRMLDFYRPGGAEREPVYVQDIIVQVLALLGPQLRQQQIEVHTQLAAKTTPVVVVRDQMQQVIFNLLINAMDAIEDAVSEQGEVTREIWIDLFNDPSQLRVRIEDSGLGVNPEMHNHIFEPFVSTKEEGTGLGLAVSYGIMEQHNGRLTIVPPSHKQGACFEIILPVLNEEEDGENINRR